MKPALKLMLKLGLIGLPILITLVTYFVFDPFMVLRSYPAYNDTQNIELNRDYVSTEVLLANVEREKYDAFIFGNSRTIAFTTKDWLRWISPAKPYHFDASSESLYGISGKLDLIDRKGWPINHALILLDSTVLKNVRDNDEHLVKKHPLVSGKSPLMFQLVFAEAYLSPTFAAPYLWRKATGQRATWLPNAFRDSTIEIDPLTNDIRATDVEHEIETQPDVYYTRQAFRFYDRADKAGTDSPAVIRDEQIQMLEHVKSILDKHHTKFKLVISPLYDQRKLNAADLAVLQRIFGAQTVFDFSGINDFTKDVHNYYEESHYRPLVGRQILEKIYPPTAGAK